MIQLIVSMNPQTGEIQVSGPLTNKLLCLGMLEMGKAQVIAYEHKEVIPAREMPKPVLLKD